MEVKNLFERPFDLAQDLTLNTLVSVEELTNYDMIYVYHHLHIGTMLTLNFEEERLNGDLVYDVYFNHFKIGKIRLSGILKHIFKGKLEMKAEIQQISKQKYLPLTGVDIMIKATKMRLVS